MDSFIFDVDGTLWDSTEIVAEAWREYLKEIEHIDLDIDSKTLKGLFGQLLPDIAKALFPWCSKEEQERLIDQCCQAEHRALLKKCAPLYPDLERVLQTLSKEYPLFIVSNCQAGYIEVFLQATGFDPYFKAHLCPGDTGMAKADNIGEISRRFHLKSPVYVGDTDGDHKACMSAGIPFIYASYGFGTTKDPDDVISCPADLLKYCREK